MKHTIIAIAIATVMASPAHATWFGGGDDITNNYGGKGGNATAGAAAGAIAGAAAGANAGASATNLNSNSIGVGVGVKNRNTNNNSVGVGVSNHNANVGFNSQGQTLRNKNDLSNRNHQGQLQGQVQGQAQDQANKQSMTYNEATGMHYSGGYEVENVPNAIAADIQPTVPCAIPLTGAGSGVGFGVSLGTAYIDKECEIRETVRLGFHGDALSKNLANQVIQSKLLEYVEEADEMAQARMKEAKRVERMASSNDPWDALDL